MVAVAVAVVVVVAVAVAVAVAAAAVAGGGGVARVAEEAAVAVAVAAVVAAGRNRGPSTRHRIGAGSAASYSAGVPGQLAHEARVLGLDNFQVPNSTSPLLTAPHQTRWEGWGGCGTLPWLVIASAGPNYRLQTQGHKHGILSPKP